MSRSIPPRLLVILLLLVCFVSVAGAAGGLSSELEGMTLVAENEYLALYLDESTTAIAVLHKLTGEVWHSNPPESGKKEQIQIAYGDGDRTFYMNNIDDSVAYGQYEITPLSDGVRIDYTLGQMWADRDYIPDIISKKRMEEKVLSKLDPEQAAELLSYFSLVELRRIEGHNRPKLSGVNLDAIFGDYTVVSLDKERMEAELEEMKLKLQSLEAQPDTEEVERRRSELTKLIADLERSISKMPGELDLIRDLLTRIKDSRPDVELLSDIKPEHVEALRDNPTYLYKGASRWREADVVRLFRSAGYTPEDKQRDHIANGFHPPAINPKIFKIPVEYHLNGEDLVVRVPCGEIEYPYETPVDFLMVGGDIVLNENGLPVYDENGATVSYPLLSIRVLEHFGGAVNQDGYIFIPDGSGVLINLDSKTVKSTRVSVYGKDASVVNTQTIETRVEPVRLPVFGLKEENRAFLAIIEQGEALADIVAKTAGGRDLVNEVSAEFRLVNKQVIAVQQGPKPPISGTRLGHVLPSVTAYESRHYLGDIVIRYSFLHGDQASYVGMARHYRTYLMDKYGLKPLEPGAGLPLFVELVGAVEKVKPVLGVPMSVAYPMTTIDQARAILEQVMQSGATNVKIEYSGWLEGGLNHILPNRVSLEDTLGNMKQLAGLRDRARDLGAELYLGTSFLTVHRDRLGYQGVARYAVRGIDRNPVLVSDYDPGTLLAREDTARYVIKPSELDELVDSFLRDFRNIEVGLAIEDMGSDVYSDPDQRAGLDQITAFTAQKYTAERMRESGRGGTDRGQATQIIVAQLQKIVSELGVKPLIRGGNAYALPYAGCLVDVPMASSGYPAESERVPFYQIVVHGLYDYAGPPLNLAQDMETALLRSIETAAGLSVVLTHSPSSDLKGTSFAHLYSTGYEEWLDPVLRAYEQLNSVVGHLRSCEIVNHEKIAPSVYMTTFDNGQSIVVNYNDHPVSIGEITVDAESFRLIEEAHLQ